MTQEEQELIERQTVGQHENPEWFRKRVGRLTASKAKQYCGRGNPTRLLRSVIKDAPLNISRAVRDGEQVVLEVKFITACRTMSPMNVVQLKQKDGSFAFKMVNQAISINGKHPWYYQVQMQMAITKIHKCHLIVFTSAEHEVYECVLDFDAQTWQAMQQNC